MPFYRFMIHGRDPRHPDDVRGFFTTRHAYAATMDRAAEKVLLRLTKEFTTGVSAAIWNSDAPKMTVEDGWRIGIHQLRSAPNRGSTFYEPETAANHPLTVICRPDTSLQQRPFG
jgi:predicted transcriptional regulator